MLSQLGVEKSFPSMGGELWKVGTVWWDNFFSKEICLSARKTSLQSMPRAQLGMSLVKLGCTGKDTHAQHKHKHKCKCAHMAIGKFTQDNTHKYDGDSYSRLWFNALLQSRPIFYILETWAILNTNNIALADWCTSVQISYDWQFQEQLIETSASLPAAESISWIFSCSWTT